MIQGAIFDADGTLLDSMSLWSHVGEDYLRALGYEPRENLSETFQTMSLHQSACYYQSQYGVRLSVEEIISGINAMVETYYRETIQLKPGAAEFLQQLKEHGVRMCIATATDGDLIGAALERCGVRSFFSRIFTCTQVGHGKEEPDIYRTAQKHLGCGKEQTIVFEDAIHALKTAKADGFLTAAVRDDSEKNQETLKELADCYLPEWTDLKTFWKFASAI